MKSLSLYVENGSWLSRLHPFTKMVYILGAIAAAVISGNLWIYTAFIIISLTALASGKLLKRTFPLIAFSFVLLITVFLIHGLFHQGNTRILFSTGPLHFYYEGMLYALKIGLNIMNMLLSFAILVLSTRPSELVDVLEQAGLSPKFGYIIISVFQIIPQMTSAMHTIMDAQRSRGMETEGNIAVRAKAFLPLISPVVMSSLINTRERAVALEIRGFGSRTKKTWFAAKVMSGLDKGIIVVLLLLIVAAAVGRFNGWLS